LKFTNEVKIGMTVVFAILIGVVGFRIMRDVPIFDNGRQLFSTFGKVDGLSIGKKIYFNGVDIGSISQVKLLENDSVLVTMTIDGLLAIPEDSRALIRATDFLGSKAILIEKGKSSRDVKNGGYLKGVFDEGTLSELQEKGLSLGDRVAEVGENLNLVLKNVNSTLNVQAKKNIEESLVELHSLTVESRKMVQENKNSVTTSLKTLNQLLIHADSLTVDTRPQIKDLIQKLNKQLDGLEKATSSLDEASNELTILLKKINSGDGTLGKLVNDSSLYTNLDSLATGLNTLIRNLDKDPKRYLKHIGFSLF
jgi:phospholipid/cholesterol/gamma-HCH transport system substrate-binding protein